MTSRPPPPHVQPLVHDGVRYEPDDTRSASLAAFDLATGARLWSVPVWTIADDPDAPPHPGRWFGRIALGPGPDDILVEDEHGVRFLVDRTRLTVRPLPPAASPSTAGR